MSNIIFSLLIIISSVCVRQALLEQGGDTRLRLALKSCDFVDLSVVGRICGGGKKIKYFKVVTAAKEQEAQAKLTLKYKMYRCLPAYHHIPHIFPHINFS